MAFDHGRSLRHNLNRRDIPSISGLRGVAALVVVCHHVVNARFPGKYAVTMFFVLSGFLITWLLGGEIERTGSLNIREFYIRRARRLFPAFYVWILLVGVFVIHGFNRELRMASVYMSDVFEAWIAHGTFGHTWSLAIEEHFYLIWPVALVALYRHRFRFQILWALVGIVEIARLWFAHAHSNYFYFAFEARTDSLVIGCILAMWLRTEPALPRWLFAPYLWVAPVAVLWSPWWDAGGNTLAAWASALLIVQMVARPPYFLNNPVARYLGGISYSLYLYHLPVVVAWWKLFPASNGGHSVLAWGNRAGVIAISLIAASASWFLVEQPLRKRGKQRVKSEGPGRRVLTLAPLTEDR